ncbi:hypothetical protein MSM1_20080 [Mycobacterium sp. SM1]|uniref:hypothetical protein n=1 Tax=Mycobacterium sp. SM1 TaxID=2816243 RepID=UPI001BCD7176|nr:hypothetical protein [Mycobacterium sp. SM1]MBS4730521.1 hypothetical protein [Mycobacterium sp. SM1]
MTAWEWAEAVENEIGTSWEEYSLARASGKIGGVEIDLEADDNNGRIITSLDGEMVIRYDEISGHWYPEELIGFQGINELRNRERN